MPVQTRLVRRGSVYYHRAAIPADIQDTYPKSEETFSLKTRDYQEALRLVKLAAVEVDSRFEAHRNLRSKAVSASKTNDPPLSLAWVEGPNNKPARQNKKALELSSADQAKNRGKSGRSPRLSQAVKAWISENANTTWVEKTTQERETCLNHFITLTCDKALQEYNKADGRAFKTLLMRLPANWSKMRALRGLGVVKAADKAVRLGLKPMSPRTANKFLGFVGAFWNWAANHYDHCPPNPVTGMAIKIKTNARDERHPFSLDQLDAIFNAPIYTGCLSAWTWMKLGSHVPRDKGIFWVPLIALWSGARLGEIVQLQVDDIRHEHGIWYFDHNEEGYGKRLKNSVSRRIIPIHKVLIDMGVLDLVRAREAKGLTRLFPELRRGKDGYYSSAFSKHFGRFLKFAGIKTSTTSFHSFRHNFEDACRNSGVSYEVMNALQGHSQQGMAGRYGEGHSITTLAKEMAKVHYEGLDLSHLLPR